MTSWQFVESSKGETMATVQEIENWIAKVGLGDRASFEQLYRATSAKLFGITLRVLKDRTEAEEALQESYVKIWRNAQRYHVNGLSPMSWLITIARNTAIDRLRARKSSAATGGSDVMEAVPDTAPGPEALAVRSSDVAALGVCLAELNSAHAEAVRGAYLDGMTYAELAQSAGVPINTMRTWLRRSLIKLKECLTR